MSQTTPAPFEDFELRLDENPSDMLTIAADSPKGQKDATVLYQEVAPLEVGPTSEAEAASIGQSLMGILFPDEIRHLYERCLGAGHRLRILISLPSKSRLHRLPFELLHDGKRHLARDDRTVLVRFLRVKEPVQAPGVDAPLRILFTTACPSGYEPLNLEAEENAVRKALMPYGNDVKLTVRHDITMEMLDDVYGGAKDDGLPFHLWHHGGHGRLGSNDDFHLVLHGNTSQIPATRLHELLSQNDALRLAVINTCHSGASGGLATMLARLEVPATVGTSSALYDSTAIDFAKAFYPSLRRLSVEEAVSQTRSRLQKKIYPFEWSKVIVFSRYREVGPILSSRKDVPEPPEPSRDSNSLLHTTHEVRADEADELCQKSIIGRGTETKVKAPKGYHGKQTIEETSR